MTQNIKHIIRRKKEILKMNMYENIELYIKNMKNSGYAKNTLINYEIHLRNFYSYCNQKNVDYKNITVKEMMLYKNILSERYKFQTINPKISVIKGFYNFLIDIEETEKNPIRDSMYIRKNRAKPKPLNKEDKHTFLSFIETKEKHIELGFKILFDTGIRISELVKLEKSNIRIMENKMYLHIVNAKGQESRLVPVFSSEIIQEIISFAAGIYNGYLFNYSIRAYQLYTEEFEKKFNIEFTTHMARHTFATEKIREGMRIDVLRKILGHKDIRTTMYYVLTDEIEILKLGGEVN